MKNAKNAEKLANQAIRKHANVLKAVPVEVMDQVAKGLAKGYDIPKKAMLKSMRRFVRLYR